MSLRRRLLLAMLDAFKWIAHSFTNLYYSLIPTTISGKKVQDKAKVVKVYGNSEVKNQLVTSNNRTKVFETTDVSTKVVQSDLNIPANSWVLMIWKQQNTLTSNTRNTPVVVMGGNNVYQSASENRNLQAGTYCWLLQTTSVLTWFGFWCHSPNVQNTLTDFQFINLTQRYPFNTPTTLTDARVQKILNGGYEEYNLGEIVDVDMGEIDSEPYNLFDGNLEIGNLSGGTNPINCHSTNYIKVYGGARLTFENGNLATNQSNGFYYREYDENFNQIGSQQSIYGALYTANTKSNFTVSNKTRYIKFFLYIDAYNFTNNMPTQLSVHVTGTRTGYADHNNFVDLANFKPTDVMGIKDTFLANSVGYKITKKIASYTFTGSEVFVDFDGAGYSMSIVINDMKAPATANDVPNVSWDLGTTIARNSMNRDKPEYTISVNTSGRLFIITTKTSSQLASALVGKTVYFELATYQIINIPLRHLGMAKIRDLSWSYNSGGAYFYATVNSIKLLTSDSTILNAYIGKYMNVNYNDFYSNPKNYTLSQSANSNLIRVKDTQYDNVTDFINAMGDEYIYFETADVVDETGIIIDKGNLSLSYQGAGVGTAHDTMEQTDTEYVFTKAMNEYTFTGSETWVAEGQQYYTTLPIQEYIKGVTTSSIGNIACCCLNPTNQTALYQGTADNGIAVGSVAQTKVVTVRSSTNITSPQTASSYMTGKNIKFELATPQVIRIPRKHLGVVRVKDLSWEYLSTTFGGSFKASVSDLKSSSAYYSIDNTYCQKFETVSRGQLSSYSFAMASQPSILFVRSVDCLNVNDFLAKYGNLIIFYETETEVADIDFTILVEAGGTLTSNWFSWVKNQLVRNGNFVNTSGWAGTNGTISANNNVLSYSITSVGNNIADNRINQDVLHIVGHKYLVSLSVYCPHDTPIRIYLNGWQLLGTATANTWTNFEAVVDNANQLNLANNMIYFECQSSNGYVIGDIVQVKNYKKCDLTKGFGAGKEPTNINDPVIKEILRLGYIPTDISGTLTNVDSKVLPDIDCKIKCK